MRITFDGHIFRWQKTGGVSRYFTEIISRLPNDFEPTILGAAQNDGNFPKHPRLTASPLSSVRPRRFSQPVKKALWHWKYISAAKVFHPSHYALTGGLKFKDIHCPMVITAHDFIQARHPDLEDEATATLAAQNESIPRAAHVICVSKATEGDLLDRYPQMAGRTRVIYHGSSFPIAPLSAEEPIFETPAFLYVGRRGTYKNFQFLLRAFAKASQSQPHLRLQVAGPPLTEEERWQIHFLGISNRIDSFVYPEESSLMQLYRKSTALLYPSRFEGFGMPPLEAMASGTLAITSNTTSLPEVVGDAGIMLDPTDESAWSECILAVANGKVQRRPYIERGLRRAATLTWEESAKQHASLYRSLA